MVFTVMSKVFVSFGQRSEREKHLAASIAGLLKSLGFEPYVAIEVQTVFEINSRLLRHLKDSDCYLFVNLRREPLGDGRFRGSLFSHQEFAIAYALGFHNIVVINQAGVAAEGMLGCVASNTETFENIDDCLAFLEKALERAGWRNDYSRRLSVGHLRFESQLIKFGELVGYFLYLDIHNHRPDIAALETTGRLSAYASAGKPFEPSTIRSPLKATGKPGYSHTIFPSSYEAFDLLCVGWSDPPYPHQRQPPASGAYSTPVTQSHGFFQANLDQPKVYLNTALDVRPLRSIPLSNGTWRLKFTFFAIEFPLLDVLIELTIKDKAFPRATLIGSESEYIEDQT